MRQLGSPASLVLLGLAVVLPHRESCKLQALTAIRNPPKKHTLAADSLSTEREAFPLLDLSLVKN